MAKFFLKKYDGDKGPTHSQVVGIVWLSVILLLVAALLIFLPRKGNDSVPEGMQTRADSVILVHKEDSLRTSRRKPAPRPDRQYHVAPQTPSAAMAERPRFDSIVPARRQRLTVELNSADTLTLQLLHGIGPARARRIVEYRERLGGYRNVEQLLEVYGIDAGLLADMAPHLTVDTTAVNKMEINRLSLKQLLRHPYIEYYQARDIVRLRDKGIAITTADDLRAVPSMNDSTLRRLLPYVAF